MRVKLVQTCGACPEQYDGYINGKQVAYFRLRWGLFTVECPDCEGELVYRHEFNDRLLGMFESEEERGEHLTRACEQVLKWCGHNVTNTETYEF